MGRAAGRACKVKVSVTHGGQRGADNRQQRRVAHRIAAVRAQRPCAGPRVAASYPQPRLKALALVGAQVEIENNV